MTKILLLAGALLGDIFFRPRAQRERPAFYAPPTRTLQ